MAEALDSVSASSNLECMAEKPAKRIGRPKLFTAQSVFVRADPELRAAINKLRRLSEDRTSIADVVRSAILTAAKNAPKRGTSRRQDRVAD